jgi:hypothetical protein
MLVDLSFRHDRATGSIQKQYEELAKKTAGSFEKNYQIWCTQACAVVKQLLPDRLTEFVQLYRGDGKRKTIDVTTYHIQDWLNGVRSQETMERIWQTPFLATLAEWIAVDFLGR